MLIGLYFQKQQSKTGNAVLLCFLRNGWCTMKSINRIWVFISWVLVFMGLFAFDWAVCLLVDRSDRSGSVLYTSIAIVLWLISNRIANWKSRCPYCGSKKTKFRYHSKGSQFLCSNCHNLILYKQFNKLKTKETVRGRTR